MTVLVVDVVDSVSLMRLHEAETVRRWTSCVRHARLQLLPQHRGQMVKSLGDGLMARFGNVADAVRAAAALHKHAEADNQCAAADARMFLRAGINVAEAWTDGVDVYGAGINVAARLATLAGPGETILSADARDELVPDLLEFACEDLGECFLKSFSEGIRAYRVGPPGPKPVVPAEADRLSSLSPTIAVIPFSCRNGTSKHAAVGDLIADGVIDRLSRSPSIKVISRLSTARFRDSAAELSTIADHLGASFVLSGGYAVQRGRQLLVTAELAEARSNKVIWTERISSSIGDLLDCQSELAHRLASAVHAAVFEEEMQHIFTRPLPNLASYSLLVGSINLMHRANASDFQSTRSVLEQLIERHGRSSVPRAWLATWYVLRATRGLSEERERDARIALDTSRGALARDPCDAQAMAVEGFVHCHLQKDLPAARERCSRAIAANPSSALAWLYMGTVEAFEGRGTEAVAATGRALELSPIDPQRYYFESLAATAGLTAHDYRRAECLARSSLRLNRMHSSTWRALAIALVAQGRVAEARETVHNLLRLEPGLTRRGYLERMPNGSLPTGQDWAAKLAEAGLPE